MAHMGEFGWWGMGMGGLAMIIFWGLLIFAVAMAVRWVMQQSGSSSTRAQTPLEILQARYARGEIEREEFEQKKRDLTASP